MFIKCKNYIMTGNGSLDSHTVWINTDEISTITDCGFESRPYNGLTLVVMKNGDRFYSDIKTEDLI